MSQGIKTYIEDLFEYLDLYEKNYGQFQDEAFFQTYHGIGAVFQALRQQRDKAIEVDNYFLEKIKSGPLNSSDLRQLTIQILITFFESEADTDGQSNRAYLYCRDLRSDKRDVDYFRNHLIPLLLREGSLNNNCELNAFLLGEITKYISRFSSVDQADLSPEAFQSLTPPLKLLELAQRRQDRGDDIIKDRNSLEFQLQRIGEFNKLIQKGSIYNYYIRKWHYLVETSFWSKLKSAVTELWGKIKSIFSSSRYFRLSLAQRNSAYFFYGLVIILFIFLAIYIPVKWSKYTEKRQIELKNHADQVARDINK